MNQKKNEKQALALFLEDALARKGFDPDPSMIRTIADSVDLVECPPDENEQRRSIRNKMDTAGNITSQSFKLYNVAKIPIYDLIGFFGKEMGIFWFENTAVKAIYAIAMLIHEFYPKLTVAFDELEAKLLYCLGLLGKKRNEPFTIQEIDRIYMSVFQDRLSSQQIEASLKILMEFRVVKRLTEKDYKLVETIKNLNRAE